VGVPLIVTVVDAVPELDRPLGIPEIAQFVAPEALKVFPLVYEDPTLALDKVESVHTGSACSSENESLLSVYPPGPVALTVIVLVPEVVALIDPKI
tara:strand:+ start:358 stop:645 length:288 start_codon:yes stop_codon:yes gene_type:complete